MHDSEIFNLLRLQTKDGDGEKKNFIELKCALRVWQVWKDDVLYFEDEEGLIARATAMELAARENIPVRITTGIKGHKGHRCCKREEHGRPQAVAGFPD
jgi:hypothetical protein